jgi:diaminopimelate epimerase
MRFVKMEGLANDFVVLEGEATEVTPRLVQELCDRRRGIGADGLLLTHRVDGGASMRYWNADGAAAEMCGNGLRCIAWLAHLRGWAGSELTVSTAIGPRTAWVIAPELVKVELGTTQLLGPCRAAGIEFHRVSVGNPHAVTFVEDPDAQPVEIIGPLLQKEGQFREGTNVEFAGVADARHIRLRVWERGVGETLACGTGAAATAAVAHNLGLTERVVQVALPGGNLDVEIDESRLAWITGPARLVYEGNLAVKDA